MLKGKMQDKWIHFIGIGGVAMAPLAIALKSQGYKITGSDKGLYEPMRSLVTKADLSVKEGFSFKNLLEKDKAMPDLVICGSGVSVKNREYLFAKKQGLEIKHFPQILQEEVVVGDSIVVVGTYAKTTITALLVGIFQQAGLEVSFMFGALPVDQADSIKLKSNKTKHSIVEGDEYISARWDPKSKFFYYKPKFLILTSAQWDHTDVFESEKKYVDNFKKLVEQMPEDGAILANKDDSNVREICQSTKTKRIWFSKSELLDWGGKNGISTNILGEYNRINSLVAAKFASYFDISMENIKQALMKFKGIKRRLEIRFQNKKYIVIDDFASSPAKVEGAISSLKKEFPKHKLVVIFEPNTGNRTLNALENFQEAFSGAYKVLLPQFSQLVKSDKYELDAEKLAEFIQEQGIDSMAFESNLELIQEVEKIQEVEEKVIFAFLTSQNAEDNIQALIEKLEEK